MKTALVLDTYSLYISTTKYFNGSVDYDGLLNLVNDLGYDTYYKIAYGNQSPIEAIKFISFLEHRGFETRFSTKWSLVELCFKIVQLVKSFDCIILGSSNYESEPLLKFIGEHGVKPIIIGTGLPDYFNTFSEVWELDNTLVKGN